MTKNLTTSLVARKNVLNNPYALTQLESNLHLGGLNFQGATVFTKLQTAEILDIDERTVDRYLSSHSNELKESGYQVIKGKALRELRLAYVDDTNVVDIINPKAPSIGIFSFRAVLNLAMLVTESERARAIRSRMLDIVIDVIAEKTGGKTLYINQRDQNYLPAAYMEDSYRKQFTDALKDCLNMGNYKYAVYTDKIYQAVFCENAKEYKKILRLANKDKTRDTMYAEVLKAIASFEHGLAVQMRELSEKLGRKLKPAELDELLSGAENNPYLKPSIEDARMRMASRDLGFRDALHNKLEHYIQSVPEGDFDRFLGEKTKALEEQLSDPKTLDVLKRLKIASMDITILYFDVDHAIRVHDWIIRHSGGLPGVKDPGQIESVIEHIQNDLYYPTFEEKLTHLMFGINKFHGFNDGNKRSSLALGAYFLELNGYEYCVTDFVLAMENIVVWLAEGKVNKELLQKLITSLIMEDEYSEELKLELLEAIGIGKS